MNLSADSNLYHVKIFRVYKELYNDTYYKYKFKINFKHIISIYIYIYIYRICDKFKLN